MFVPHPSLLRQAGLFLPSAESITGSAKPSGETQQLVGFILVRPPASLNCISVTKTLCRTVCMLRCIIECIIKC